MWHRGNTNIYHNNEIFIDYAYGSNWGLSGGGGFGSPKSSKSLIGSGFFFEGFKLKFFMFNGDWGVIGVARRVGINCGWDCTKKFEDKIFNGEWLSRIGGGGAIPNGSTWKVELVAGG